MKNLIALFILILSSSVSFAEIYRITPKQVLDFSLVDRKDKACRDSQGSLGQIFTLNTDVGEFKKFSCIYMGEWQTIIEGFITDNTSGEKCLKYENCRGYNCYREYGRTEIIQRELIVITESKSQIVRDIRENYKTECR